MSIVIWSAAQCINGLYFVPKSLEIYKNCAESTGGGKFWGISLGGHFETRGGSSFCSSVRNGEAWN